MLGGIFGTNPIALTYLTQSLFNKISGSRLGTVRTVYFLIASIGSVVVGAMADRGLFSKLVYFLGALAVMVFLATLVLHRFAK